MKKLVIALLLCSVTTWGQVRKAKAFEADVKSDTIRVLTDPEALKFTFNRYQQAQQKIDDAQKQFQQQLQKKLYRKFLNFSKNMNKN